MKEFRKIRQDPGGFKRLFFDEVFDLYIWYHEHNGEITGFQLVYRAGDTAKALTWRRQAGIIHQDVDGWDNTSYEGTPFLVPDGKFDAETVMPGLISALDSVDEPVRKLVLTTLDEWLAGKP